MKYQNTREAVFLSRPNRFIAIVELDGKEEVCHVKNTGRCKELLFPGTKVLVQKSDNPERKTKYDLIAVQKCRRWINMDSQAPNQLVAEWIARGNLFTEKAQVYPEKNWGNSRFDFYVEDGERKAFLEVKGVTLEEDSVARFPDAPTERGLKHIQELMLCKEQGFEAILIFVIQMDKISLFEPNWRTQPEFAEMLKEAQEKGVEILAVECKVKPGELTIADPVEINLERPFLQEESVKTLLKWFADNQRDLPWRKEKNAYYTWVSEIMLQQTRVEAVKPYFERFIQELPDVEALSLCPEEKLLKLWEGLGYYNRVRNMQKAALQVMQKYNGRLPEHYDHLRELAGIGNYTAGAVASIAYNLPAPCVDGNVLRVMSRIMGDSSDISRQEVKHRFENETRRVLPQKQAGDYNQAMMEVGALVCVPNGKPLCEKCPFESVCIAHRNHEEEQYPVKAAKKERKTEQRTILILQDDKRIAIRKRPKKGLLAGLYEFPNLEGHLSAKDVICEVEKMMLEPLYIERIEDAKHIFSHVEWRMIAYRIKVASLDQNRFEDMLFINRNDWEEQYAIPSAFQVYMKYLTMEH